MTTPEQISLITPEPEKLAELRTKLNSDILKLDELKTQQKASAKLWRDVIGEASERILETAHYLKEWTE